MFLLTSCHTEQSPETVHFPYRQTDTLLNPDGTYNSILIENPSDEDMQIRFQINDKFWFTKKQMLDAIRNLEADSLPNTSREVSNAWVFVMLNTWHYRETPLGKRFAYSPGYFINSFGGGLCSNRNASLCHIWEALGYQSRCPHLQGHLVTEVFDNNKWKLLDADFNRYFLNSNNQIAGFHELEDSIANYAMQYNREVPNNQLTPSYYMPKPYYTLFTSTHNNEIQEWYKHGVIWRNSHLSIPAGARLFLLCNNPKDTSSAYAYGKLIIPGEFAGIVNMPFIVHHTENTRTISYRDYLNFPEYANPPGQYFLYGTDATLYFYINPLCVQLFPANTVSISKTKAAALSVSKRHFSPQNTYLTYLSERQRFFNILNENRSFFVQYRNIIDSGVLFSEINDITQLKNTVFHLDKLITVYSPDKDALISNILTVEELINSQIIDPSVFFEFIHIPKHLYEVLWRIYLLKPNVFKESIKRNAARLSND